MTRNEVMRQIDKLDSIGWRMVGIDGEGPEWVEYMRDDEYPKLLGEYQKLNDLLHNEEESAPWLH